ncbi:protein PFC0760c-like isoform X2 [Hydractinia symbiolongicarpus]|uniref:protein PFC0760c-like isoform X2 n=1 Tax=Hydractinia symbiolongicarpus TaxID=13093 RepID=UPI002550B4B5|nr:protein PFC0760c-like isoform X2 [Hydractinia symbiolongicarpus]
MATPSPPSSRQGHPNRNNRPNQLVPTKFAIDDIITSQGSLRRDVLKNDATMQAVRQENIMLAEKVQHAANLYRQLLGRVTKTEERMEMEQKSMTQVLSQTKQVELQLATQQEGMVNRETQLVLRLQKIQEDVSILKTEKELARKQNVQLSQEVRQLQEKVARQSGSLSNGLQDLKAHLDQKDLEKSQMFNMNFNELREKVETQEHQKIMFQTQMEGMIETLKMQVHQYDKQRQEDLYNMSTLSREKEALAKADIRRLQEKFKDIFEEFHRSVSGKDGKLRSDIQGRVAELERKLNSQSKNTMQRIKEIEQEAEDEIRTMKEAVESEIDDFRQKLETGLQNELNSTVQVDKILKVIEKQIGQNKKDIEKVVRAEISSRLSQGEKLSHQLNQLHKDHSDEINMLQEAIAESKRKQDNQIESSKVELTRFLNTALKENKCSFEEKRFCEVERKIDEIEDGLDEMSKQDERIELNSERIKQMEMENILAQGDMHNAIDANSKLIKHVDESLKKEIRLLEKKLNYLTDDFEEFKKVQDKNNSLISSEKITSQNKKKLKEVEDQLYKIAEKMAILQKVLSAKVDDEHNKEKVIRNKPSQTRSMQQKIQKNLTNDQRRKSNTEILQGHPLENSTNKQIKKTQLINPVLSQQRLQICLMDMLQSNFFIKHKISVRKAIEIDFFTYNINYWGIYQTWKMYRIKMQWLKLLTRKIRNNYENDENDSKTVEKNDSCNSQNNDGRNDKCTESKHSVMNKGGKTMDGKDQNRDKKDGAKVKTAKNDEHNDDNGKVQGCKNHDEGSDKEIYANIAKDDDKQTNDGDEEDGIEDEITEQSEEANTDDSSEEEEKDGNDNEDVSDDVGDGDKEDDDEEEEGKADDNDNEYDGDGDKEDDNDDEEEEEERDDDNDGDGDKDDEDNDEEDEKEEDSNDDDDGDDEEEDGDDQEEDSDDEEDDGDGDDDDEENDSDGDDDDDDEEGDGDNDGDNDDDGEKDDDEGEEQKAEDNDDDEGEEEEEEEEEEENECYVKDKDKDNKETSNIKNNKPANSE